MKIYMGNKILKVFSILCIFICSTVVTKRRQLYSKHLETKRGSWCGQNKRFYWACSKKIQEQKKTAWPRSLFNETEIFITLQDRCPHCLEVCQLFWSWKKFHLDRKPMQIFVFSIKYSTKSQSRSGTNKILIITTWIQKGWLKIFVICRCHKTY